MTFRGLVNLILFIGVILFGMKIYQSSAMNEPNKIKEPISSNSNELIRQNGDYKMVFERSGTLQQSYLLFGVDIFNKKGISDGFVAGIPLPKAMDLLRQYPSMQNCGAPGSNIAKSAIQNLQLVIDSNSMKSTLKNVRTRFRARDRENEKRLCLKISGEKFTVTKLYYRDQLVDWRGDALELVKPTNLEIIPCK